MGPTSNFQPISSSFSSFSIMLLVLAIAAMQAAAYPKVFNVLDFGAVADGKIDNSKAFASAWGEACAWEKGKVKVLIPKGTFLTGPVNFMGPYKRPMVQHVRGLVLAPSDLNAFPAPDWVVFKYLSGLTVTGRGKFHGQGALSWPKNDCRKNSKCSFPTSIRMGFVNDSLVQRISSVDSKMFHFMIFASHNIRIRNINIITPEDSPNTDGIHLGLSTNITITDSKIGTGDDCISVGSGNNGVYISNVFCGPGHGISIGSLGRSEKDTDVANLCVMNCTFTNTMNGVRIKTWQDSYVLSASNFTFEDILMNDVSNPFIIDQEYCPEGGCIGQPPSRVKINNVKFNKIRGTSSSEVAINLKCSKTVPCRGVELSNVNLSYSGKLENVIATAACSNVIGTSLGTTIPPSCI